MSAVREVAAVRFSAPVDGTGAAKPRRSTGSRRRLATPVQGFSVHPAVWRAAQAALRPGERLVIVGPDEVRTTYR